MQFGFQWFPRGMGIQRDAIVAMAAAAERLSYDYIAVSDHIVVPRGIESTYPYSEDGSWAGAAVGECGEQLTVMAYLAALTSRVRLLSSVMVVPHRQAVLTAKILATIDAMSDGRLTVGCGAGWMAEEFAALQTPPFEERGQVTDDFIEAFKALWTSDDPRSDSPYVRFDDVDFAPKPTQKPHPPIWVGGESAPAIRRAARHADAWYPGSANPRFRINTPQIYAQKSEQLAQLATEAGRDPETIDRAYFVMQPVEPEAKKDSEGNRRPFTGSAADIAGDIDGFAGVGVTTMIVIFQLHDLDALVDRMSWFAEEVRPLTRA